MRTAPETLLLIGILLTGFILPTASNTLEESDFIPNSSRLEGQGDELREGAFHILDSKCNVCHRKQNPFRIFSRKNMDKNAPRIYKQVFVKRRMPKGDIRLTDEEYQMLEEWINGI